MILSLKTAKLTGGVILVTFPNNDSRLMDTILMIGNVRMRHDEKWEIPVNEKNIQLLKTLGFELSKSLLDWNDLGHTPKNPIQYKLPSPKNGLSLYPYQKQGVQFIDEKNGRVLIADEMGLGKTVQALTWIEIHPEIRPILIICPSSLKLNWKREIEKWVTKPKIQILEGTKTSKITGNIVIINYDIVHYWVDKLKSYNFKCMVLDEVHYTKNHGTKRTKAIKRLNKYIDHIIALSGTPIENKPIELYNVIQMVDPELFPNYYMFVNRYCGAERKFGQLVAAGATNTLELNAILKRSIMIRRKKADVLKELPPKQIVQVPLSISNRSEYNIAEKSFIDFVQQRYSGVDLEDDVKEELKKYAKRHKIEVSEDLSHLETENIKELKIEKFQAAPALAQIEVLKQLAVEGKLSEIVNWIETFLESGEKLVVFAIHTKVIDHLMKFFPKAVKIDGTITGNKRQEAVDKFQNDVNTKLLIANIKAGGVGLTLTAASNIAIIQLPWNPALLSQAIDRVHRITQVHQVTAWILIGERTIEEKILTLLKEKEKILSEVLDGQQYKDMSILMSLINSYKKIKN